MFAFADEVFNPRDPFDLHKDEAFSDKPKYPSLAANISVLGYECRLVITDILQPRPSLTVSGLQLAGLPKFKQTNKNEFNKY